MTRCIYTLSRWGETYRKRYFVNGKRVTESEFDSALAPILDNGNLHKSTETKGGLIRYTWESKQ